MRSTASSPKSRPSVRWKRPPRWRVDPLTTTDLGFENASDATEFAHHSELQFARLLDFYGIEWEYEPMSFAIEYDEEGSPTGYFTPDFYLPDEDLFIEITTMNQKLVTKKNRKIRLLQEHHPGVRCKIFYQRDYLHLVVKYELEPPSPSDEPAAPTRIPGPPQVLNLGETETG